MVKKRMMLDPEAGGHRRAGGALRVIGPIVLGAGILMLVIAIANFFMAFGGSEPPKLFWCAFIGIPLIGVGGGMTQFGYMGKVARYVANETAPVARDTVNYMVDGTKDSVRDMSRSVAAGFSEGLGAGGLGSILGGSEAQVRCHKCSEIIDADAKFCPACGAQQAKNKSCPDCAEANDPDARFCDNCGHRFE